MTNRPSHPRIATDFLPALFTAVAATFLLTSSLAWATQESVGEYDQRVGWTIFSTIEMNPDSEPPDTEALLEYKRRGGSVARDGETWAWWDYVRSRVDQKQINWYAEIVRLADDWALDPEHEAQWTRFEVATDPETDAQIFFREATKNEVRHTRVYFRLIRGRVMAKMWIQRAGAESPQEAVDKAIGRWRFFVAQAHEKQVFVTEDVFIAALPTPGTDFEGQIERNGVVRLVVDRSRAVEFPMEIWAEAASIVPDEPYWLKLQYKDELGQPGVRLLDQSEAELSDLNGDGWLDLWVERGDTPARVLLLFEPFRLRSDGETRAQMLNQIAQLRVGYVTGPQPDAQGQRAGPMHAAYSSEEPGAAHSSRLLRVRGDMDEDGVDNGMVTRDVAIERTDWMIIVTRFELLPRTQPEYPDEGSREEGSEDSDEARHYNELQRASADLRTNWEMNVLPLVEFRQEYQRDEKVPLGWRMDPYGAKDFWLAMNDPDNPSPAGSFPLRSESRLFVDIRIDLGQRPRTGSYDAEPDNFDSTFISAEEEEGEFRRFLVMDDLDITVSRVADKGVAFPEEEAERSQAEQELAERIRGPAGGSADDPKYWQAWPEPGKKEWIIISRRQPEALFQPQFLEDVFPMEEERGLVPADGMVLRPLTVSTGIFEIRFKAALYYKSGENRKEVDVAMRYNVMPGAYRVRTLEYTTQRVR